MPLAGRDKRQGVSLGSVGHQLPPLCKAPERAVQDRPLAHGMDAVLGQLPWCESGDVTDSEHARVGCRAQEAVNGDESPVVYSKSGTANPVRRCSSGGKNGDCSTEPSSRRT